MAQYRNINVRSPFYVQLATTESNTGLELRIWEGDVVTDKPELANYTLSKEQQGGASTFEIAEIIRDFCSQTSVVTSGSVWVETILDDTVATPTTTIYLASEGYTLYKDGVNHNGNSWESDFVALPTQMSSTVMRQITYSGGSIIPVYVQPQGNISLTGTFGATNLSTSITGTSTLFTTELSVGENIEIDGVPYEVASIVSDTSLTLTSGYSGITAVGLLGTIVRNWRYLTYDSSGSANGWVEFPQSTNSADMFRYITVNDLISRVDFDFNGATQTVLIDVLEVTKYSHGLGTGSKAVSLMYVNKFGARSEMVFSLKHTEAISVQSTSFQRNVMNTVTLTNGSGLHANRRNITTSKQSFVINTDWLNEYHVEQIEELTLSEYVWAKYMDETLDYQAVNIKSDRLDVKNHLNDKLIQFSMELELASEYINTVR